MKRILTLILTILLIVLTTTLYAQTIPIVSNRYIISMPGNYTIHVPYTQINIIQTTGNIYIKYPRNITLILETPTILKIVGNIYINNQNITTIPENISGKYTVEIKYVYPININIKGKDKIDINIYRILLQETPTCIRMIIPYKTNITQINTSITISTTIKNTTIIPKIENNKIIIKICKPYLITLRGSIVIYLKIWAAKPYKIQLGKPQIEVTLRQKYEKYYNLHEKLIRAYIWTISKMKNHIEMTGEADDLYPYWDLNSYVASSSWGYSVYSCLYLIYLYVINSSKVYGTPLIYLLTNYNIEDNGFPDNILNILKNLEVKMCGITNIEVGKFGYMSTGNWGLYFDSSTLFSDLAYVTFNYIFYNYGINVTKIFMKADKYVGINEAFRIFYELVHVVHIAKDINGTIDYNTICNRFTRDMYYNYYDSNVYPCTGITSRYVPQLDKVIHFIVVRLSGNVTVELPIEPVITLLGKYYLHIPLRYPLLPYGGLSFMNVLFSSVDFGGSNLTGFYSMAICHSNVSDFVGNLVVLGEASRAVNMSVRTVIGRHAFANVSGVLSYAYVPYGVDGLCISVRRGSASVYVKWNSSFTMLKIGSRYVKPILYPVYVREGEGVCVFHGFMSGNYVVFLGNLPRVVGTYVSNNVVNVTYMCNNGNCSIGVSPKSGSIDYIRVFVNGSDVSGVKCSPGISAPGCVWINGSMAVVRTFGSGVHNVVVYVNVKPGIGLSRSDRKIVISLENPYDYPITMTVSWTFYYSSGGSYINATGIIVPRKSVYIYDLEIPSNVSKAVITVSDVFHTIVVTRTYTFTTLPSNRMLLIYGAVGAAVIVGALLIVLRRRHSVVRRGREMFTLQGL
ncbi:MAG: hypothetical protein GXO26_07975 [Crenarchaeota archaeon]|nr:hypothetical protein [Thermoproteota archaeon]